MGAFKLRYAWPLPVGEFAVFDEQGTQTEKSFACASRVSQVYSSSMGRCRVLEGREKENAREFSLTYTTLQIKTKHNPTRPEIESKQALYDLYIAGRHFPMMPCCRAGVLGMVAFTCTKG